MNRRFEEYLNRFCSAHKILSDSAKKHVIVMEVERYYEDESKFKVNRD